MNWSVIDMVITTFGVPLTMVLLSCLCCLCMKFSDLRTESYLVETAEQRGFYVDLEKLNPKYVSQTPMTKEVCTIMVPDVTIIL